MIHIHSARIDTETTWVTVAARNQPGSQPPMHNIMLKLKEHSPSEKRLLDPWLPKKWGCRYRYSGPCPPASQEAQEGTINLPGEARDALGAELDHARRRKKR
jgi:hypothetical protein